MHPSAFENGRLFFDTYLSPQAAPTVLDIGAQDVNGSLRSLAPAASHYIGVDFAPGRGVDVVLDDPYHLPFADGSIDAVVSSSCFEHIELFWLRITSPLWLILLVLFAVGFAAGRLSGRRKPVKK